MKLRTVFAFLSAPIIGVVAGALAMSLVVPGNVAMFSLLYAIVGAGIALVGSIVIGGPTVYFVRRASQPLLPWLLFIAIMTGLLVAIGLQCALSQAGCSIGPIHNVVFAVTSAVITAIVLSLLVRTERPL